MGLLFNSLGKFWYPIFPIIRAFIWFENLWSDWLDYQLFEIVSGTLLDRLGNEEIVDSMPEIIQEENRQKYTYVAEKAGIFPS